MMGGGSHPFMFPGMCRMPASCTPQQEKQTQKGALLPSTPLSRGARGPGVAQLQHCLIQLGHMHPGAIRFCAGMYGPRTHTAILKLQRAHGVVEPTGAYDEPTRALLEAQLRAVSGAEPEATGQGGKEAGAAESEVEAAHVAQQVLEEKADRARGAEEEAEEVEAARKVAEDAEQVARQADANERAALLISVGFSEIEVAGALHATQGSLERAADWLFEARQKAVDAEAAKDPEEAAFPEDWVGILADCVEMGFPEASAKKALTETDGKLKNAVKILVQGERNQ